MVGSRQAEYYGYAQSAAGRRLLGEKGEGRGERGDGGAAHGGQAGVQLRHDVIADPLV